MLIYIYQKEGSCPHGQSHMFYYSLGYKNKNLSDSLTLSKYESSLIFKRTLLVKSKLKIPSKDFASTVYLSEDKENSESNSDIVSINFLILVSEFNFIIRLFMIIHLEIIF